MTDPGAALRAYLPWVRSGLAAALPRPDNGSAGPAVASVPLRLWINDPQQEAEDRSVSVPVALSGPGDVTGLTPAQVVRTFPGHLSGDAEAGLFPLVEFDRADLPWLFTPRKATAEQRLRPWLVLVVVSAADSSLGRAPGATLSVLDCPLAELPDLAESWAWAHAQVVRPDDSLTLDQTLAGAPERSVSRLVCPRRLLPGTAYRACVVPAFATGRQQGLGTKPAADAPLTPAWPLSGDDARVRLPVYFYWEFATGGSGDFESLARRLTYQELPATVGDRALDIARPGWGVPDQAPRLVDAPAALRVPSSPPREWPEAERSRYAAALAAAIARDADGADVSPPIYGGLPSRTSRAGEGAPTWLTELNTDPRHRAAAGLGAFVVKLQQEQLVSEAWAQLPDDLAATPRTRAEVATEVARSVVERHLDALPPLLRRQATEPVNRGRRHASVRSPALAGAVTGPGRPDTLPAPRTSAAYRRLQRFAPPASGGPDDDGVRLAPAVRPSAAGGLGRTSLAQAAADPPARFAPQFRQAGYELLRDYSPELLLPGGADVPVNSVSLLTADAAFVEAFLVGMNDEIARELTWRGYPADPRATFFAQFWGEGGETPELPDIRGWDPASRLGSHLRGAQDGLLVLLLRGELLRSYPRTRVDAVEAVWATSGARVLGATTKPPMFRVRWGADTTLLGFALTEDAARGTADPAEHPGWWFVLSEPPEDARFGLDAAGAYGGTPATWDDLSWGDLAADAAGLEALSHVPLRGRLDGVTRDGLAWGSDSAAMAVITEQKPFRLAVHASGWLPEAPA